MPYRARSGHIVPWQALKLAKYRWLHAQWRWQALADAVAWNLNLPWL
jgi:hypothetical protein